MESVERENDMESRKIQKVGAATLTISLPSAWVRKRRLKKGDQVFLIEEGEALKVLTQQEARSRNDAAMEFRVDADLCDEPGMLERVIVGNYVLGRQKVIVTSSSRLRSDHIQEIRQAVKHLTGLGIIEESESRITLQCAIDPAHYPLDTLIKRLFNLSATMLGESIEALVTGDGSLAEDAIKREEDADTMYWLILRLVLSAQLDEGLVETLGMRSRLEIPGYRAIAKDLETVADRCEEIAHAVLLLIEEKVELSPTIAKQMKEMCTAVIDLYGKALGGLLSRDLKQANEAIRKQAGIKKRESDIVRLYLKDYDDPNVILPFRTIVHSITETAEYAKSIAVIAYNRYLEKPSNLSRPAGPP